MFVPIFNLISIFYHIQILITIFGISSESLERFVLWFVLSLVRKFCFRFNSFTATNCWKSKFELKSTRNQNLHEQKLKYLKQFKSNDYSEATLAFTNKVARIEQNQFEKMCLADGHNSSKR